MAARRAQGTLGLSGTHHRRGRERLLPLSMLFIDGGAGRGVEKRTLTNLHNQRPTWLDNAHRRLDEAVFAAYGWLGDLSDDEILARLLELNLKRAGK